MNISLISSSGNSKITWSRYLAYYLTAVSAPYLSIFSTNEKPAYKLEYSVHIGIL